MLPAIFRHAKGGVVDDHFALFSKIYYSNIIAKLNKIPIFANQNKSIGLAHLARAFDWQSKVTGSSPVFSTPPTQL